MFSNRYPLVIFYAISLHLTQAISLAVDPSVGGITSLYTIQRLLHSRELTIVTICFVALVALYGLMQEKRWLAILLTLPQQFFLFIASYGAIDAIIQGRFADGVLRSRWFLLADQSPTIFAAAGHTFAILALMQFGMLIGRQHGKR